MFIPIHMLIGRRPVLGSRIIVQLPHTNTITRRNIPAWNIPARKWQEPLPGPRSHWTVSVRLTVRVCVPETPDKVSVFVTGAGCDVPPAGAELLPASFAAAFPPPQPTKPPMHSRTKQNRPESILLRLFPAINANVPSGSTTAAKAPTRGCRRNRG